MIATESSVKRVEQAIRAVLPAGSPIDPAVFDGDLVSVDLGTARLTAKWIGEGWLRDARAALARSGRKPEVLVARRMSPGARAAAADDHVGWIDESGAAEIALPGLLVSRTGRKDRKLTRPPHWSPSVIGTAEALLLGTRPTVTAVERRTGLSVGSATNALSSLAQLGLLQSSAARGPTSARQVTDRHRLLDTYAEAAITRTPVLSLRVGTAGKDLIDELANLGKRWDAEGLAWAATGAAAASVLGPYLSEVTGLDILVDASTPAMLDALAERSGLRPIEGGRILLRPFPTPVTRRLSGTKSGQRTAPWPRVYADLRNTGVRGEEAAEHLREVVQRG